MTDGSKSARDLGPPERGRTGDLPREPSAGSTQDELLDEALKETFPASDPISVYRLD
jgi:hypothetical protein